MSNIDVIAGYLCQVLGLERIPETLRSRLVQADTMIRSIAGGGLTPREAALVVVLSEPIREAKPAPEPLDGEPAFDLPLVEPSRPIKAGQRVQVIVNKAVFPGVVVRPRIKGDQVSVRLAGQTEPIVVTRDKVDPLED